MSTGFLIPVFIASLLSCGVYGVPQSGENCDKTKCGNTGLLKYYLELNCTPIYEDGSCCPVRYDCSTLALRSSNKCHFQGDEYEVQSEVSSNKTVRNCLAACGCHSINGQANFLCAQIECAELFNGPLEDLTCVRQYSLDTCCSTGTLCPNKTSSEENKKVFQCEYQGQKYYIGQKFFPDGECKTCVCEEGYDGTTNEPWCKVFPCNVELNKGRQISQGCVPVFYTSAGCCPIDWQCPSENDTIIQGPFHKTSDNSTQENTENQLVCNFGSLKMALQDKLSPQGSGDVECTCVIPPYLTCIYVKSEVP